MSEASQEPKLDHQIPDKAIPEAGLLGAGIAKVGVIFAIGIVISALILFYEVIMRYGFNAPTTWAHETVVFINASAFIFGGLYAAALNRHIRVVLFYDNLSLKLRRVFDVLISAVCMISSGFFAWAAWQSVKRAAWTPGGDFRLETSGSAWNPPFPGMLKVFLFFILIVLAIQFLVLAINYAKRKGAE